MENVWRLCTLEQPDKNGIYEVRLEEKDSSISNYETSIMEFKDGEWLMRLSHLINEFRVVSWRYL